jgi:hypothetical protein
LKALSSFVFHLITGQFRKAYETVSHLRLGTKLAFLGIGVGSYALQQYPDVILFYVERGYYLASMAVQPKSDAIPLSTAAKKNLSDLIRTLQYDLSVEMRRRNLGISAGYNSWAIAQMAVALDDASPVPTAEVRETYEKTLDESCGCWRETPQAQPHTGATGWVVFSMSEFGMQTPPRILEFMLAMQSPDGWWPLYPAKREPSNASTYATDWAALSLCTQLPLQKKHGHNDAVVARMSFAVENALNWLAKNEVVQAARWIDYPANTSSMRSISISGLTIHVLNRCGHTQGLTALHQRWLEAMPFEVTSASMTEASNADIFLDQGLEFDRTRHYVLQWALIATVDAYASGNLAQRAAAVQWIERMLKPTLIGPEVRSQRWVAAELLYALGYLQAHIVR